MLEPASAEPLVRRQSLAQRARALPVAQGAEPELGAWRPEQEQAALQRLEQLVAFAEPPELLVLQPQAVAPEQQRVSGEPLWRQLLSRLCRPRLQPQRQRRLRLAPEWYGELSQQRPPG